MYLQAGRAYRMRRLEEIARLRTPGADRDPHRLVLAESVHHVGNVLERIRAPIERDDRRVTRIDRQICSGVRCR